MSSREKILAAVKNNQPAFVDLSPLSAVQAAEEFLAKNFSVMLETIGGAVFVVSGFDSIATIIKEKFADAKRIVSTCPELSGTHFGDLGTAIEVNADIRYDDVHELSDIDLAVIRAHFGVAENAAVWVTEELMIERAVPFICQHLAVVIPKKDIVPTMREAYDKIAGAQYGFGTFIAGPSKTADIEQSLVLGAHGPKSMTVFLVDAESSDAGFY